MSYVALQQARDDMPGKAIQITWSPFFESSKLFVAMILRGAGVRFVFVVPVPDELNAEDHRRNGCVSRSLRPWSKHRATKHNSTVQYELRERCRSIPCCIENNSVVLTVTLAPF